MSHFFKLARKILLPPAIALMALAGAGSAHALSCTFSAVNPLRAAFNQVNVSDNAAVGETLATMMFSFPISCPANHSVSQNLSGFYMTYEMYSGLGVPTTIPGVWGLPTPVKGVGVRITNTTHNVVLGGTGCNVNQTVGCQFVPNSLTAVPDAFTMNINFMVELVKTGDITWGSPGTAPIFSARSYDVPLKTFSNIMGGISFGNTSLTLSTCSVLTPSLSVTLPTLNVSELSPTGMTGGNQPFQIDLKCSAGKNIYVTLTDASNPGNTTNQLNLASDSTASGVKLQILRSGVTSPVNFGPDAAVSGNPGQWLVGPSGTTSHIPLTVQYVSTGPVKPGTVKASTTFTLYYP